MASSKFPMISKSFRLIGAHEPALLRQKLLPAGVALSQARRQGTRTSRSFQPVIPILEKYDPNRQFPVPWKPNFYSELKDALKRRVNSFITFFYVPSSLGGKFYSPAFWTQLGQTAKDLYVQMNTAFARSV